MFLCDLEQWRTRKIEEKFFSNIEKYSSKLIFPDQDIFNATFYKETQYLPPRWNVYANVPYVHKDEAEEAFRDADKMIGLIHYASASKPWFYVENCKYSSVWWYYASQTHFLGEILIRYHRFWRRKSQKHEKMLYILAKLNYYKLLKYKYRLLKHCAFSLHQRWNKKYALYKTLVHEALQYRKDLIKKDTYDS